MKRRPTVMTVVGARPQFIKAAPLSRALRSRVREVLVHTGQHYDDAMSAAFFRELRIPAPFRNLGIGSGSHGRMTGRMLETLEATLREVRPEILIVLGDTNSTLAGALAAAKLGIRVAHVEAGLRSFDRRMPEEINRRLTDHLATLLFCPTRAAVANLRHEGIVSGVYRVGDVMFDAVQLNAARAGRLRFERPAAGTYYLATIHRQENVDDPERLRKLLAAFDRLPRPVLLPLHPRTRARLRGGRLVPGANLRLRPPASYLETLALVRDARAVLTDSGGLQKEAFMLGVPCLTLRATTEWVETLRGGWNRLVDCDPDAIAAGVADVERRRWRRRAAPADYGAGQAAQAIAAIIARELE